MNVIYAKWQWHNLRVWLTAIGSLTKKTTLCYASKTECKNRIHTNFSLNISFIWEKDLIRFNSSTAGDLEKIILFYYNFYLHCIHVFVFNGGTQIQICWNVSFSLSFPCNSVLWPFSPTPLCLCGMRAATTGLAMITLLRMKEHWNYIFVVFWMCTFYCIWAQQYLRLTL